MTLFNFIIAIAFYVVRPKLTVEVGQGRGHAKVGGDFLRKRARDLRASFVAQVILTGLYGHAGGVLLLIKCANALYRHRAANGITVHIWRDGFRYF